MAISQNGWVANEIDLTTSIRVPGGSLRVRAGDVAAVFTWLAARFNAEVEPLVWPGCWGYAERTIRGSATAISNHASGTAVDFNAPAHPLGRVGTYTAAQVSAIRRILDDAQGVIRWGGDYSGRKDEMHFEINAPATRVAALARTIQEDDMPTPADVWAQPIPRPANTPQSAGGQLGSANVNAYRAYQAALRIEAGQAALTAALQAVAKAGTGGIDMAAVQAAAEAGATQALKSAAAALIAGDHS